MYRIFISYRREDSEDFAGRIADYLEHRFGEQVGFLDVHDLPPGVDYREYICGEVGRCDLVLVVIGPIWLDVRDEQGRRRLDDPDDFLRIEIERALARRIPVVPLLVRSAVQPRAELLPSTIQDLAFRNAFQLQSGRSFRTDMEELCRRLERMVLAEPGGTLQEPCLDCQTMNPASAKYCHRCGCDLVSRLQARFDELHAEQLEIERLRDNRQLLEALDRLTKLSATAHPALREFADWARNQLSDVQRELKSQSSDVLPPPPETTSQTPSFCLTDVLRSCGNYTVITGARRQYPKCGVRLPSDILLGIGWSDFALLGQLPQPERHDIVPDEYFAEDRQLGQQREIFQRVLVGVGAPEVNFAALDLNGGAVFRFVLEAQAKSDFFAFVERLRNARNRRVYGFNASDQRTIDDFVERLCPLAFLDPFAAGFVRNKQVTQFHHGLLSLAIHPNGRSEPCIFAAGVTGPTTAGAVSLLAGRAIFDPINNCLAGIETRPFGGVFRRRGPSKPPPYDVLAIEDDLEWVTPPYDKPQLLSQLKAMQDSAHMPPSVTREDISRLMELVGGLHPHTTPDLPPQPGEVSVVVLVGGQGARMKDYTQGKMSKVELAIQIPTADDSLSGETVLGMLVRALTSVKAVRRILLLTSDRFLERHRALARVLETRYGVQIPVQSDGVKEDVRLPEVVLQTVVDLARRGSPVLVMMGDTLFHPDDLQRLLVWMQREQPLLGVVCSRISCGETERYGMVRADSRGCADRIVEKPGDTSLRIASQGTYVLSPYVQWDRMLPEEGVSDLVTYFNHVVEKGVSAHTFETGRMVYDCGSPKGYDQAKVDGLAGKLW
jgi:hypothetical protein